MKSQISPLIVVGPVRSSFRVLRRWIVTCTAALAASGILAQDGSLDLTWLPRDSAGNEIWTDNIGTILVQPDGKILASSYYSFRSLTPSGPQIIDPHLMLLLRLNTDGSLDSFRPKMNLFNNTIVPPYFFGRAHGLAFQPDGSIVLGGDRFNGEFCLGQLNAAGLPDFGVRLLPIEAIISALGVQPDGKIVIGGNFIGLEKIGGGPLPGSPGRRNVARFHPGGALDLSFDPGTGASHPVNCLAVQPDGKIVIGGRFTSYNNTPSFGLARLNPNGSLDTSFSVNWSQVGLSGSLIYVNTVVLMADGRMLIGTGSNFAASQGRMVWRLESDGTFDLSFPPALSGDVYAILVQPDNKIVIGGAFQTVSGVPRRNIARLNSDGTLDLSFDPGTGTFGAVQRLALHGNDGLLIAGTGLQTVNGVSRSWIARLHCSLGPPPDTAAPVPDVAELPTVVGECSVYITETPTATDDTAGQVVGTTTDPLSFTEQGTYTITWLYDDLRGNVSTQTQTVVVQDTTAPQLVCPGNLSVGCSVELLVPVQFSVTASDNCDGAPAVECTPPSGSLFPIGTTHVTCTTSDAAGNPAECSFDVVRAPLGFSGFLGPINGADATGGSFTDPLRTFKAGSTVPVKFLADCNNSPVLTGTHRLQVVKYTDETTHGDPIDATPQGAASSGDQFVLIEGVWTFKLDTQETGMSKGIWLFKVTLSDGSEHTAWLQLK